MANICVYKGIVKGKKNACYAFFGSMSNMGNKKERSWTGSDEYGELHFIGDCKWSVDSYCEPFGGEKPVALPEDYKEARALGEHDYWYNTVQERSEMFQVEVQCCSADIEDYECDDDMLYEHYINGKPVNDECPEILKINFADPWDSAKTFV